MNIDPFKYSDYRNLVKDLSKAHGLTFKILAANSRIHTSYFSRVMQGNADFSPEQLYLVGQGLKLSEEALDYLLLLGEWSSSASSEHKAFIKRKLNQIQKEKLRLKEKLKGDHKELTEEDIEVYYRSPLTAKVHMFLTIKRFQDNPHLIASRLFISERELENELSKLRSLKLINKKNKILKFGVHLEESHPASPRNHANWRLESVQRLIREKTLPSDYHLSVLFSCDENTKIKIKEEFKNFTLKARELIEDCHDPNEIYHLSMDLY